MGKTTTKVETIYRKTVRGPMAKLNQIVNQLISDGYKIASVSARRKSAIQIDPTRCVVVAERSAFNG